jgi:hypothetical protein
LFAIKIDLFAGSKPTHLCIDDLDGDGKPEIIVTNSEALTVSVFKNISAGGTISFAAKTDFAPVLLRLGLLQLTSMAIINLTWQLQITELTQFPSLKTQVLEELFLFRRNQILLQGMSDRNFSY